MGARRADSGPVPDRSAAPNPPSTPPAPPPAAGRIVVEATRPSVLGAAAWSSIAGPWEIDYSYAGMRAIEAHPFNDSTGPRTFWWVLKQDGRPVGMSTGYVTETYNFTTLFGFGVVRWSAVIWDRVYVVLNRRGWYRHLERRNLALLLRVNAGRSRAMFLITPTADVGGHVIGQELRDGPPAAYLPAMLAAIDAKARELGAEQITIREAAEGDAGPFRYPNLWQARDATGGSILRRAGYSRDPGFPPAYVDLRHVQATRPLDGDAIYAFYRHDSAAAFVTYETQRRAWLAEVASELESARSEGKPDALPIERLLRHPGIAARTDATRLHRFRTQLFRSGILPDALVELAQLDRAERVLKTAPRTVRRVGRLEAIAHELHRRAASVTGDLPTAAGSDVPALLLARAIAGGEPAPPAEDVGRLAIACEEEQRLVATMDPRFTSLPSARRSTLLQLAAGRIRHPEREREKLLAAMRTVPGEEHLPQVALEAGLDELIALAAAEADRDREVRRLRTEISELRRRTGVQPDDAADAVRAQALLAAFGGQLPEEVAAAVGTLAAITARLDDTERRIGDARRHLHHEALALQPLLLGEAAEQVRDELDATMRATFRREQDRVATDAAGGVPPRSAADRRARVEGILAYRPLDFGRLLRDVESLRDSDRQRLVREHDEHRAAVRAVAPLQPGPVMPAFDAEGYLERGLAFTPRDERAWVNLADQDRITELYHRTMANSLIRHDVEDWPYRAAYREAGRETGDEIHVSTLRAGGSDGPIVAAVTLKRSPAGHFRPERIAKPGPDFGAYYSLVILVMANELASGGTFCSLGQTAQGTKMREFGATFTNVREYTRFQGILPRLLSFDLIRRHAFRKVRLDRILEIAALPPAERKAAARRYGIRWRV